MAQENKISLGRKYKRTRKKIYHIKLKETIQTLLVIRPPRTTDCIVTSSQAKDSEAFESRGEKDL